MIRPSQSVGWPSPLLIPLSKKKGPMQSSIINRRDFLKLGAIAVSDLGFSSELWAQMPRFRSTNGLLEVALEAAPFSTYLAGRRALLLAYNRSVPGSMIETCP